MNIHSETFEWFSARNIWQASGGPLSAAVTQT